MGFAVDCRARSLKGRGWFRKAPDPREVVARVERLAGRVFGSALSRKGKKGDRFIVELRLLDTGPVATLSVEPDGEIRLAGETSTLGPGYHAELVWRTAKLLDELDYGWTEPFDEAATARRMCEWLAGELRGGLRRLGMPEDRGFRIDAQLLSALGPRDAAWCARVQADPMQALDVFPWPERGPGRRERARALIAMWQEVPWRIPLDEDERQLMQDVHEDLLAARKADPKIVLPWSAWKQLIQQLDDFDPAVSEKAGSDPATIGYRRYDLEADLSGGWSVVMPGAMIGHWSDDDSSYWATDGDRVLEFASYTASGETSSESLLAVAPEKHAVIARHAEGNQCGRAEAYDDEHTRIVVGIMADAPHVGILTCRNVEDAWALATWKSLRRPGQER